MAAEVEEARPRRWYFSKEKLSNSPSRADGVDPEKELRYRQDAASLIQEMGPRLGLNPLCVSTAIVYMHRFYMINSFKAFDRGITATAALFLAAKVEELPKKLEFVAKCSYCLLHRDAPPLEVNSEAYNKIVDDITFHELTILQTLGFDVQVKHPHPHVVECMNLVGVSKDLSQAAFFLAHNSQLLTTFCLQYPPTVVACMCIHLTCVWKGLEIPRSNDNKNWWEYVDRKVTQNKLEELAKEFLTIVEKSPTRLRKRIQENFKMAVEGSRASGGSHGNKQLSKPKEYHMLHPSSISSKPHPSHHHPRPGSKPHPPSHQQHKTHQSSSPPPPPPPPPSHSTTYNSHLVKHRKHKDHHEVPPPSSTGPSHKPEKHSLTDPNFSAQKSKKIKTEDAQVQHKQHMSLKDYRQSKRQQQYQQLKSAPTKMKPPDQSSRSHSNSHLPSLPPMANSHSFQSKPPSSSRTHSNHSALPPLPPPLPSHNPDYTPPPPPPFTSS